MARFDVDGAVEVMTAWVGVDDATDDRADRLRHVVDRLGPAEVVNSLINLCVAQLAMLKGAGGDAPAAAVETVRQKPQRALATDSDVTIAAAILEAFWAGKAQDDEERLVRACQVAAQYADGEATASLVALNVGLLSLLGVSYEKTPAEALAMVVRVSELGQRNAGKFLLGIRGPRSFARFVLDGYNAVRGTTVGAKGPPDSSQE